jgi:3-oxoacyl-[acyl-carrier-protein] synthase II
MTNNNRVVVTGFGIICAIGNNKEEFLNSLKNGTDGVKNITLFDASGYRTDKAGMIDFEPIDQDKIKNPDHDRCLYLIEHASNLAMEDSGLMLDKSLAYNYGVSLATSLGCVDYLEKYIKGKESSDSDCLNDELLHNLTFVPHSIPTSYLASKYNFTGPVFTVDTACASGTNSIGYAYDKIANNECDIMITGGVDVLNLLSFSGFSSMMNLTQTKCTPFDTKRSGLVLGEGAAIFIFEKYESAKKRGAKIYAEVCGYGISNDAYHETQPDPNAGGAIRAMEMALSTQNIRTNSIDYINAHGTGTKFNDLMESVAIKNMFEGVEEKPFVSSTKAATGHALGAAGAIEFAACLMAVSQNFIPPTLNLENSLEQMQEYDFVPKNSVEYDINYAMSNSFGFAGNCSSIVIKKVNNLVESN